MHGGIKNCWGLSTNFMSGGGGKRIFGEKDRKKGTCPYGREPLSQNQQRGVGGGFWGGGGGFGGVVCLGWFGGGGLGGGFFGRGKKVEQPEKTSTFSRDHHGVARKRKRSQRVTNTTCQRPKKRKLSYPPIRQED